MKKTFIAVILTLLMCGCAPESLSVREETQSTEETPSPTPVPTQLVLQPPEKYDNTDTKSIGWGMVRKKGAPPEVDKKSRELLEAHNGYYIDHSGSKTLYLTFDEGYENGFTAQILDVLASENVPAAFFVTGPYLENQQELVKRMIDEGHTVGNHPVNHMNLSKQTAQKVQSELNNLNKRCAELYGVNMKYMRPPEGEYSEKVLSVAEDMGYKTILWSFAYKDWDVNLQKGEDYAFSQITPYLHDGSIMLLHAVSSDNAAVLKREITYAKDAGFEFKSLDDLCD